MNTPTKRPPEVIEAAKKWLSGPLSDIEARHVAKLLTPAVFYDGTRHVASIVTFSASLVLRDALACAEQDRDELSAADRRCLQIEARMADCEECNRQLYSELAEARKENARLRTLWTEARVVVAKGRDANCLVSYGATQVEAVEMANAWLDKMQAPSVDEEIARQANDGTLNATIDAARDAGKGGAS